MTLFVTLAHESVKGFKETIRAIFLEFFMRLDLNGILSM